jgi:hypothetical protein
MDQLHLNGILDFRKLLTERRRRSSQAYKAVAEMGHLGAVSACAKVNR